MEKLILTNLEPPEIKDLLREVICEELEKLFAGKPMSLKSEPEFLTIEEAAKLVGLAKTTLYEKTHLKVIPHYKRGRRLYFKRAELEIWISGGKVKTVLELDMEAATLLNRINLKKRNKKKKGQKRTS